MSEETTKEKELSPEQVRELFEQRKQYYQERIDFLKVELEYETLQTQIDEQRFKRIAYQVKYAEMMATPPSEDELNENAQEEAAPKERKLRKN